ncbi:hypothetical protein D3C72_2402560 [compost metagenome]
MVCLVVDCVGGVWELLYNFCYGIISSGYYCFVLWDLFLCQSPVVAIYWGGTAGCFWGFGFLGFNFWFGFGDAFVFDGAVQARAQTLA